MFNAPTAVAAISRRAGIPHAFNRQVARKLRERGLLPTRRGNTAATITSRQLALLLVACLCGPGVGVACDRAVRFVNNDGLIVALANLIDSFGSRTAPRLHTLALNLTDLSSTVCTGTPDKPAVQANVAALLKMEVVLPGSVFHEIINDMYQH